MGRRHPTLPPNDLLRAARLRLPSPSGSFFTARCEAIDQRLPDVEYALPPGPIHGDAHTGNLLGAPGAALLTDFEVFATGPREWDLSRWPEVLSVTLG